MVPILVHVALGEARTLDNANLGFAALPLSYEGDLISVKQNSIINNMFCEQLYCGFQINWFWEINQKVLTEFAQKNKTIWEDSPQKKRLLREKHEKTQLHVNHN